MALGGRLAEELVYGDVDTTTGASNDLQQVASIARRMVMEWGMSDKVGPIGIQSGDSSRPFMGRAMNKEIVKTASDEVDRLVNNAYVLAKKLLMENRDLLDALAAKLMEQETVSAEEFQVLINKYGKYMSPYSVFGESYGVDALPFQEIALEGEPKAMA